MQAPQLLRPRTPSATDVQALWVPGPLPGLNEIINARGSKSGFGNPWASKKKQWAKRIGDLCDLQELKRVQGTCWTYVCLEKTKARDPTNIFGGAAKVIEDALKDCKRIDNDGWAQVRGLAPYFAVGPKIGVLVVITVARTLSELEAFDVAEKMGLFDASTTEVLGLPVHGDARWYGAHSGSGVAAR